MGFVTKWLGWARNRTYESAIRAFDDGRFETAIELFSRCLEEPADHATLRLAHFYIGESYSQLGHLALNAAQYDCAAEAFERALQEHPKYADLQFYLALAKRKLGLAAEALSLVSRSLEINPRYGRAVLLQGLIWYESGRRSDGLQRIELAATIDRSLAGGVIERFVELHTSGSHEIAIEVLEAVLFGDTDETKVHARLADNARKAGEYEHAAAEYEKALACAPNFADLRCRFGEVLLELGRPETAADQFEEALRLNPGYLEAQLGMVRALNKAERNIEARAMLEQILRQDPQNQEARFLQESLAA